MDDYLAFAKDLARRGGQLITDNFEKHQTVELKSDHTPVTDVDKLINEQFNAAVQAKFPGHGVIGEEVSLGNGSEEYQWLCDPLDGTKSFILGIPNSTCILALTRRGEVLLSVIYHPSTSRLYHAVKGQGAFCNDQPIQVNDHGLNDGYVLLEASSFGFVAALQQSGAILEPVGGAGYQSALIASGRASAMVKGRFALHDIGPGSLIVQEAGGRVTHLDGSDFDFRRPATDGVVLSNGVCHDDLLAITAAV